MVGAFSNIVGGRQVEFPQGLKPSFYGARNGTAEAVPLQTRLLMPSIVVLIVVLCSSLPLMAADKANADVLGRWVGGTWPLDGKMLDTEFSKALTVTGVSNCGWSPDHVFMVCDQSLLEDGKPSREMSAYVCDPDNGTFHFYGLSPEGGRPHTSDVVISADGNHWEYQNKTEIKGKMVQFRTINEWRTPDSIEWWAEYSSDEGQHWTRMGGGSEKRKK